MEGKIHSIGTIIMGVLILNLVVAHSQVVRKTCCKNLEARRCFNSCRLVPRACAAECNCIIIPTTRICPPSYPEISPMENSDAMYDYCKLGCASSMCNSLSTIQKSVGGEKVANEAMELCNNECSVFCTKGSTNVVLETA